MHFRKCVSLVLSFIECRWQHNIDGAVMTIKSVRHVCLNVKLLAIDGSNNLTFFRVPLMNSLYISDRRYRL